MATSTRSADSTDSSHQKFDSATDPDVTRDGSTHSSVMGEVSPSLPHERDESSDSGSGNADPMIEQAVRDVQAAEKKKEKQEPEKAPAETTKTEGVQPQKTDRGEASDPVYQRTLAGDRG